MLIEAGIACIAHGITSLIVHGLPSAKLAVQTMKNNVIINKVIFSFIWVSFYSILAPITFYRLFQDNDKWIPIYTFMIVQSFSDEEM